MGDAQVIPLTDFDSRYPLVPGSPSREVTRPRPKTIGPVGRSNLGVPKRDAIGFSIDEISGVKIAHRAKEVKTRLRGRNRHLVSKFLESRKKK